MTTPNWIKMRTDLRDHPKVVRMASATKTDTLRIIGALWAVWGTFDTHSVDGTLEGYSLATIDEKTFRSFGRAMVAVHWLEETEDGLVIPEFDEHNGASAKRRATDSKRKAEGRDADKSYGGSWNSDGQKSADDADKKQTRVRVEREKKTPVVPSAGFADFWEAWPKSERKGGKAECIALWEKSGLEVEASDIVDHVKAMSSTESWTKQGGSFVPAPAVYLRGRRWDGAELGANGSPTSVWAEAH